MSRSDRTSVSSRSGLEDADADGELCAQLRYITAYGLQRREGKNPDAINLLQHNWGIVSRPTGTLRSGSTTFVTNTDALCVSRLLDIKTECRHPENSYKTRCLGWFSLLQRAQPAGVSLSIYSRVVNNHCCHRGLSSGGMDELSGPYNVDQTSSNVLFCLSKIFSLTFFEWIVKIVGVFI